MAHQAATQTRSEDVQIRKLNQMLQSGQPALVGANGERLKLPATVVRLLKDIARNMQLGRPSY